MAQVSAAVAFDVLPSMLKLISSLNAISGEPCTSKLPRQDGGFRTESISNLTSTGPANGLPYLVTTAIADLIMMDTSTAASESDATHALRTVKPRWCATT